MPEFLARRLIPAALPLLLLGACGQDVPEAREDAALPPEPPAVQAPSPAAEPVSYSCANGRTVQARYPDANTAAVTFDGRTTILMRAPSETGVRFVGAGLEWRTQARGGGSDEGSLRVLADRPLAGELLAECSQAGSVQSRP